TVAMHVIICKYPIRTAVIAIAAFAILITIAIKINRIVNNSYQKHYKDIIKIYDYREKLHKQIERVHLQRAREAKNTEERLLWEEAASENERAATRYARLKQEYQKKLGEARWGNAEE